MWRDVPPADEPGGTPEIHHQGLGAWTMETQLLALAFLWQEMLHFPSAVR